MSQLTLTLPDAESFLLEASIEYTQKRTCDFEEQYQMSTQEFLERYEKTRFKKRWGQSSG